MQFLHNSKQWLCRWSITSHCKEGVPSVKMVFSNEQCCFIIERYFSNNKSFTTMRQLFREKHGEHYMLPDSTINRIIQRFRNEHTILWRKGSGRPWNVTPQKREEVKQAVIANRRVCIWRLAPCVELSRATTHRLLRELNFKPYRLSVCQELKAGDHGWRVAYCRWLEWFAHGGASHFDNVYF